MGSSRAPRMVDVARLAGVSPQTVSRVVNDHPHVTSAVRARVEAAITQLRYRRNPAARTLVTSRTMSIGVVTWGLAQHGPSVALTGIADAARSAGYTTSLVALAELDQPTVAAAVGHLVDDHVDGIIVLAPVAAAVLAIHGVDPGLPVILFEPGASPRVDNFGVDEAAGARAATEHLLSLGHTRVAHVSGPDGWLATGARIRGWRQALDSAGLAAPIPIPAAWDAASGYEAAVQLAEYPDVTAVFVANDQTALGLIRGLASRGCSVPEDVSVVGFDDFPEAGFFRPPLTTVRVDFAALGKLAVCKLLALINGESPPETDPIVPELVVRESTAPLVAPQSSQT